MPVAQGSLASFEEALPYRFRDQALLRKALVHTSYVNERIEQQLESNERLEFLGDAVLGMVVAHRLYELRPEASEGDLTIIRAWLVRESTLARWAARLALGEALQLGRGEVRTGGRRRPAILARAFEAVIGAVFLDGGIEAAREVLLPLLDRDLDTGFVPHRIVDAKSRLQQVSQSRFGTTPEYRLVEVLGPGHAPHFEFEVVVGSEILARGAGSSKRVAQQAAAHAALTLLGDAERHEVPEQQDVYDSAE